MISSKVRLLLVNRSSVVTNTIPGIEGFIHLAAPVGGIFDLDLALDIGRRAALNALEACAKTPSV
jgi:hypothetical protein